MSGLGDHLASLIAAGGPITVASYMAEALSHPRWGYYQRQEPFGRAGDFVTAPEISQMFGEMLGLWCIERWQAMGRPARVALVELGPGRGTLTTDLLRAAQVAPDFRAAMDLHLVETSERLRGAQRETIAAQTDPDGVTWHDRVETVPDRPALYLANEFFDALPIHQMVATDAGWRERLVACDGGPLYFALAPGPTPALTLLDRLDLPKPSPRDAVAEVAPAALALTETLGARLARTPGAALIADFAKDGPLGDSLQAVRGHARHDVLDTPGEADLAAKVDFATMARTARRAGASVYGPIEQGVFLRALGIELRAERLSAGASAAQARDIAGALKRLTDPNEMGSLFSMLAFGHPDLPPPPGFPTPEAGS